jgi:hypothetical protein
VDGASTQEVNGDISNPPTSDEASNPANIAEISGGSDTEAFGDNTDILKDGSRGHTRSNSVKKPTSFKSVSVTKNFLAKTATSSTPGRSEKGGLTHDIV